MKKVKGEYTNRENLEWSSYGLHSKILNFIKNTNGSKALDVGCGTGMLGNKIALKGYDVYGIDIDNHLKYHNINFRRADLDLSWPLKDEFFHLVTATEIIEHLENPRHFIREIKRILRNKGIAIISTPNVFCWKGLLYYLLRNAIWGFGKNDYEINGHITPITEYDVRRICKEEGLNVKKIVYNNSSISLFGSNLIIIIEK